MSVQSDPSQSGNRLLGRLSPQEYEPLSAHIEVVEVSIREAAFKRNREFRHVYFPISCVMSVITPLRNDISVEVASIGNEGFTGCDLLIGGSVAVENCICQVPGKSARMRVAVFQQAIDGDTPLRRISNQYMRTYISQIARTAACNRMHSTEERFARWTLMMRDRAGSDHFSLNTEFLTYMLGESRSKVNLVANTFVHAGLLRYADGYITLLKGDRIEEISCDCYRAMAFSRDHLPEPTPRA
ncbi:Crp/Fnr family transcriptional regulator [Noviherbaspirillum sp.]|uniref:Crp/Fnr family transcriptional regulator n=1 Tax=Noviherbaspirillum sp. TaxID=1926288 RepID=UPI002FE40B5E